MALPPVTTGLVYALQADTLGLADGASVTSWPDSTSNHNDPTVTGSLLYGTARTPLGTSAVEFGAGQLTLPSTLLATSTGAEMFWVLRSTKSTDDNPGVWDFGGGDRTYWPAGDGVYDGAFTSTRFHLSAITAADTHNWHVFNVSHDGTRWRAFLDGQQVYSTPVGYVIPGSFVIGHNFYDWVGDIAETLLYSRALSSAERTSVLDYLYTTHVSATPPPAEPDDLNPLIVTATFSGQYDSGEWSSAHLFDDDPGTHWADWITHTVYAQAEFAAPVTVTRYDINAGQWGAQAPRDWTLDASPDGTTWTTLDTRTAASWSSSGETKMYSIAAPAGYRYYRWSVTANVGAPTGTVNVSELVLRGSVGGAALAAPPIDLTLTLPRPLRVDAPPLDLDLLLAGSNQTLDAPPLDLDLDLTAAPLRSVTAPPIELVFTVRPPAVYRIQRIRLRPEPGSTVPVRNPLFVVDFTVIDGDLVRDVAVDIQIAAHTSAHVEDTAPGAAMDALFAAATTLSTTVQPIVGVNTVRLTPAAPLDPGTYAWRLRVNGGAWTPQPWPFTVPSASPATSIPLTWTVTAGPTDPWIWIVDPDRIVPGDTITILGQGFASTAAVKLGDAALTVSEVTLNVAATARAATAERTIDTANAIVDPEHDRIVAIVPTAVTDGGPLTVTDGP